jgi:large subunit ribosomal protein L30
MAEVKETKKATKTTQNSKRLLVTLVKSPIGYNETQRKTLKSLGLNKIDSSNELADNAAIRGMIFKVKHLVKVEEIN